MHFPYHLLPSFKQSIMSPSIRCLLCLSSYVYYTDLSADTDFVPIYLICVWQEKQETSRHAHYDSSLREPSGILATCWNAQYAAHNPKTFHFTTRPFIYVFLNKWTYSQCTFKAQFDFIPHSPLKKWRFSHWILGSVIYNVYMFETAAIIRTVLKV